ncbi:MAG: c-type cytochrome [Deltaproteobacteria bacterium]|nr:c-type cytochrome [Deltaproteobacteria bacterium]
MSNFLRVVLFGLVVIGAYAAFAAVFTPSIKPEPPPAEETVSVAAAMTQEEFARFGERLYHGKGQCALCHNAAGGRAPSLDAVAINAARRIISPDYKGGAKDAAAYLYESMTAPSAYVVPGYGAAGTSPMPGVRKEPIGLNETEMRGVIAFLQSRAGVTVTAAPPKAGEQ